MRIRVEGGLPWVTARLVLAGREATLERMLVDTGSAATVVRVDHMLALGIEFAPEDPVFRMRGVGGVELVVGRKVDRLDVAGIAVESFQVQVGAMEYGFPIDGLLGLDFLIASGAVLDFSRLELTSS